MRVQDETLVALVDEVLWLLRSLRGLAHESPGSGPRLAHAGILGTIAQFGPCRATELSEYIGVGVSVLSRQLSDLQDSGYIDRERDPADGRAALIKLTPEGERVLAVVVAERAEQMRERLQAQGWDQEKAHRVLESVNHLAKAFGRQACTDLAQALSTAENAPPAEARAVAGAVQGAQVCPEPVPESSPL